MALALANRVQETSTTTGTGTLTLAGAVAGFRTFAAGIGSGNTCYYAITSPTGDWEVGVGTVGTGTLARTTLLSSSTGSLVSFTGTLNVFVTYPSERSVNLDESSNLTVLNTTRLGGASGNQSLQVDNVVSAVNYARIVGAVSGGAPAFSAVGTDTNIPLIYNVKGASTHNFRNSNGNTSFVVNANAGAVDYCYVSGSPSGFPTFGVQGASANIGLTISSKGTQGLFFKTNGSVQQFQISDTPTAVNFINLTGGATGAAPTFSALGSDAIVDIKFTPKSTGSTYSPTFAASNGLMLNNATIAVSYTLPTGYNAMSAGPITINSGITVTVPSGSTWVVV